MSRFVKITEFDRIEKGNEILLEPKIPKEYENWEVIEVGKDYVILKENIETEIDMIKQDIKKIKDDLKMIKEKLGMVSK